MTWRGSPPFVDYTIAADCLAGVVILPLVIKPTPPRRDIWITAEKWPVFHAVQSLPSSQSTNPNTVLFYRIKESQLCLKKSTWLYYTALWSHKIASLETFLFQRVIYNTTQWCPGDRLQCVLINCCFLRFLLEVLGHDIVSCWVAKLCTTWIGLWKRERKMY